MPSEINGLLVDQFVKALETASKTRLSPERHFEIAFERAEGGTRHLDLLLRMGPPHEDLFLAVEVIREGYPRDVRNAVWQLEEYRLASGHGPQVIPVVLAEHLSRGARTSLRDRNVAYFDASESLYLSHGQWLINIERSDKPALQPRRAGSLFTDSREQVVHALLQSKQAWLSGKEVATLAETSTYTVSLTLQELERLEWVESQGSGRNLRRRLAQPGKLLDAWSEAWRNRKESRTRWYMYSPTPNNLMLTITDKLNRAEISGWAFTGTAAANVLAPQLTSVDTTEVIVPPGRSESFADAMALKKADKGANVILVERSGASLLFCEQHPEFSSWFASPFIQYLDLLDGRGRNKELAAHFRKIILKL